MDLQINIVVSDTFRIVYLFRTASGKVVKAWLVKDLPGNFLVIHELQ